jgi:hypothetical protein
MPTRTFQSSKSSLFASTSSSKLGGGQDTHLPVGGPWNGYTFRGAIAFALDFSGMRRITSAVLKLRTSSAVHVGFSSAPDFYIARATEGWSANSSSGSSDGGSGWSTSPDVYPGPASTTTGRVSKRAPTSESTWFDTDITAIVRAWAPSSVEGGGDAGKYGLLLYYVASGDVTEFQSHESTYNPSIVVTYETDQPPVATMTGPTGVVGTTRPALAGSATDPNGDPIENVHVRVYSGGGTTAVYDADLGPVPAGAWSHVPTVDLPGGALTAQAYATAAGVGSAWSNVVDFTVDRPAVVTTFAEPPATTPSRRPNIAWNYSDPDGDVAQAYHVEVYQSVGGAPSGAPVWAAYDQTAGINPGWISVVPTADLPGGDLLVRTAVRTGPAYLWSSWSAYHPFRVVLDAPSVSWITPDVDGGYLPHAWILDIAGPLSTRQAHSRVDVRPPSGQTITTTRVDLKFGAGGWVNWTPNLGIPAAGGEAALGWNADGGSGAYPYGSGRVRWTVTASGGGVTTVERAWRASIGEWFGSVALGDQVSDLTVGLALKGAGQPQAGQAWDDSWLWVRAESAPGVAAPGANWENYLDGGALVSHVVAKMPATNAYLGLRIRYVQREPPVDVLANGSFEDGLAGWATDAGTTYLLVAGGPDGTQYLRIPGDGFTSYPQIRQVVEVLPNASYRVSAWMGAFEAATNMHVRVDAILDEGGSTDNVLVLTRSSGFDTALAYYESGPYLVPPNVHRLQVLAFIAAVPSASNQDGRWDGIRLIGPKPGAAGLDRIDLGWKSLG